MSIAFEESKLIENLARGKQRVRIKSYPRNASPNYLGKQGPEILIGPACVSMEVFCEMVKYVLTNTDLEGDEDPRYDLIALLQSTVVAEGNNPKQKRITFR